ncbi:electron transfer flavoprotein subunit beta/FixA family protein [Ancylomarina sp. 16SWW S1-10-2]|uniref:electron transfer flavoprotein subunit beta/FixA family protein n=1 Tax=Ancylomarina sp. 16SWW S1-10-2 TaxID=2499681 RepID=UPI0012AE48C7|nr:electron transfer flavoprotein subunit beta/FixA family protein [Ancylomarina sp. 16SWW S1-10-2]MRT94138.1 electron transfer flavoprotein beta subunit/FixA family protein [Ancylomarina sp. 16SWW S1-10-2]
MKILVCISNVPDTTTKVKLTDDNKQIDNAGVQWIINPWDELALTRAIELKEDSSNTIDEVCVVNVGLNQSDATLRKALAIGADKAIRIDAEPLDAYFVAGQIAAYVKENPFDIVLSGIESSDYNGSSVGGMLSEFMDCPAISSMTKLDVENENIIIHRAIPGGKQILELKPPFIGIVQKGITNEPRIPAMRGIMMARKKPLEVVAAVELDSLSHIVEFELPKAKASCQMIAADQLEELVHLLKSEAKVL